jgi:hypothetical protein
MSTELTKTNSAYVILNTDVGEIREAMEANVGDGQVASGDFDRIKVPAGGATAWTVQTLDGEEMMKELVGIVVAWRDTRAYWRASMEEGDGNSPPDCSSVDAKTGVGAPGGDCRECELAKFGSDSKGEGQACKLIRQLLLIREDNRLPEIVSLPPSSVKSARQYFLRLASRGVPCYGVITRLGLEKTKNNQGIAYSRATFTSGGRLSADETAQAKAYADMISGYLSDTPVVAAQPRGPGEEPGEVVEGEVI